jgi:hypothetical protein
MMPIKNLGRHIGGQDLKMVFIMFEILSSSYLMLRATTKSMIYAPLDFFISTLSLATVVFSRLNSEQIF